MMDQIREQVSRPWEPGSRSHAPELVKGCSATYVLKVVWTVFFSLCMWSRLFLCMTDVRALPGIES